MIADLRDHLGDHHHVALMIEHLTDDRYAAIDVPNAVDATGCWYDRYLYDMGEYAAAGSVDVRVVRLLDATRDFAPGKSPVIYTEKHDHSTIVNRVGGGDGGGARSRPDRARHHAGRAPPAQRPGVRRRSRASLRRARARRPPARAVAPGRRSDRTVAAAVPRAAVAPPGRASRTDRPQRLPARVRRALDGLHEFGYGADRERGLVIYHRWGPSADGRLERLIVVLNFSETHHLVDIPFSVVGRWEDLLNGDAVDVPDHWARAQSVPSHWGRIYWRAD